MNISKNQLRHINLQQGEQETLLRKSLYDTLVAAVAAAKSDSDMCRVLDVGVGRGELLKRLRALGYATHGIDLEAGCVEMASEYGDCRQGGVDDIERVFSGVKFDVIVCSHVLEHLDNPSLALELFAGLGASNYVFAVPNPLRPVRILKNIFRSHRADHPEHVYAWAHPEFESMLNRCGFVVESWYTDRVTINPLRGGLGKLLTFLFMPLESGIFPRLFPMFSSSLIVSCYVKKKEESIK